MALIQNYTLAMLCVDALEAAKKDPEWAPAMEKLSNFESKCPWALPYPIISKNISASMKIEFTANEATVACIDIVGDIPIRRNEKKLRLFRLLADRADGDAYAAMHTVCSLLCFHVDRLIVEHSKVLVSDWSLYVSKKSGNRRTTARVRDLLRRKNRQISTDLDGENGRSEPIPKEELLDFLLLVKTQFPNILTPRKMERLDILIQEQQGLRPGPKEIQRIIRAKRKSEN